MKRARPTLPKEKQAVQFKWGNFYFGVYSEARKVTKTSVDSDGKEIIETIEEPPVIWAPIHKPGYGARRVNWIDPETKKTSYMGYVRCLPDETGSVLRRRFFKEGKLNEEVIMTKLAVKRLVKLGKWERTPSYEFEDMVEFCRFGYFKGADLLERFPERAQELHHRGLISEAEYRSTMTQRQLEIFNQSQEKARHMTRVRMERRARSEESKATVLGLDVFTDDEQSNPNFDPLDPLTALLPAARYFKRAGKYYESDVTTGEARRLPSKPKFKSILDCQKWYHSQVLAVSAGSKKLDHHPIMDVAAYSWNAVLCCMCDEYIKRLNEEKQVNARLQDELISQLQMFNRENVFLFMKPLPEMTELKRVQEEFLRDAEKLVNQINDWASDPDNNPVVKFSKRYCATTDTKRISLIRMIEPMPEDFMTWLKLYVLGRCSARQASLILSKAPHTCIQQEIQRRHMEADAKTSLDELCEELNRLQDAGMDLTKHELFGIKFFLNKDGELFMPQPDISRYLNWYPEIGMKNRGLAKAKSLAEAAEVALEYGMRLYVRGHLWQNSLKFVYKEQTYQVHLGSGKISWVDPRTDSAKLLSLSDKAAAYADKHAQNVQNKLTAKGAPRAVIQEVSDRVYMKDVNYLANGSNAYLLKEVKEVNSQAYSRLRRCLSDIDVDDGSRVSEAISAGGRCTVSGLGLTLPLSLSVDKAVKVSFRLGTFSGTAQFESIWI